MKRIHVLAGVSPELEGPLRRYMAGQSDMVLLDCVHDGERVVARLQSWDVDVVVVELILPRLDALGVLDQIARLAQPARPQVLVVSPTGREAMIRGLLQAGADYCLVRPFHMEVLGARLRQLASGPVPIPCLTRPSTAASSSPVHGRGGPSAWEAVGRLLSDLGIPTWVNGYRYLWRTLAISRHLSPTTAISGAGPLPLRQRAQA
jgi:two-component system response regulator (stage 0 sporulation protein A)